MTAAFAPTSTRIIIFAVEPEGHHSVEDIVEFPCGVAEAYQWARRLRGPAWAGKPHVAEQIGRRDGSRHETSKASTYWTPKSPFPR